MEPIKDTTQRELSEIIDNPVDQAGNRIKLRSVSHANLLRHLKNIPYQTNTEPQIVSSQVNATEDAKKWSLTPKQYMDHIGGKAKPINVKQSMLDNIVKHSTVIEVEQTPVVNEMQPTTSEVKPLISEATTPVNDEIKNETTEVNMQVEEATEAALTADEVTQQILMKKETLAQETTEASESDKRVQELGVQYTEVQKQIEESTQKREAMLAKKRELEKSQSETMRNAIKKYDSLIEEVRARKVKNAELIADLETKINNGMEEIKSINEEIARLEEETNALSFDNVVEFPQMAEEESFVKRIG